MKTAEILNNSDYFDAGSPGDNLATKKLSGLTMDKSYLEFIERINGGFFYNYSLHLYAVNTVFNFHNIFSVNEAIRMAFEKIVGNVFFFGQEIFGNQFGFSDQGIVFFNVETGDMKWMAKDFEGWTQALVSDLDYFTGRNLALEWARTMGALKPEERLCPKKPFIIGGAFSIGNAYPLAFPKYINTNANIANQIYGLPDGTPIKLKIID